MARIHAGRFGSHRFPARPGGTIGLRISQMTLRFTVLASGSSGNATYLHANDLGILLDIGLGPRELTNRLAQIGASWRDIHCVLLTHTHTDHWSDRTIMQLRDR